MPRVAQEPRRVAAARRSVSGSGMAASSYQSPMKIPLNDDVQEKAKRLQSRHALHEVQMNNIKAAASPMRKLTNFERANSASPNQNPKTPRARAATLLSNKENAMDEELLHIGGSVVTPMKRVPILANFEEWMKMATDNKINAANSWNFALIDYFHDMSLLKEGDGVNFQKASCTLDGCVKIYTSRVDSVATETGKLLSGLADSGSSKKRRGGEEDGEGEDSEVEVEDEDGVVRKKQKKKAQRSHEATLAPTFASLQLKKMELEFAVDPLFKKASADFDEGGAKGLLLNHLAIDSQGRIVFDSSDDAGDASAEGKAARRKDDVAMEDDADELDSMGVAEAIDEQPEEVDEEVDVAALGLRFFPDLERLEIEDICPSLKTFVLGDASSSMDLPFLKSTENWREERDKAREATVFGDKTGFDLDDDNPAGFDDDEDDGMLAGFDGPDVGFGEGGEAWAKDAAIDPQLRVHNIGEDEDQPLGEDGDPEGFDPSRSQFLVSLNPSGGGHEDILSYFDQALQKNWAGPEHWRIRKIKDASKDSATVKPRKEKEPFEIDFLSPLNRATAAIIYTPATATTSISMPKKDWKSKTRNLLPDDKHFNSKQLLRLFLKPRAHLGSKRIGPRNTTGLNAQQTAKEDEHPEGEMDEAFWANKEVVLPSLEDGATQGDYDANFFQDDGLAFPGGFDEDDEDAFADARDHFSPGVEERAAGLAGLLTGSQAEGAFGSQLVTQSRRLRPEYVQYARVAKKVDMRRLKEEMWKGLGIVDSASSAKPNISVLPTPSNSPDTTPSKKATGDESFKFTEVMQELQKAYPKQVAADISTSYCFICLLHLANEKGLVIEKQEGLQELVITKDHTAEITIGGD